MKILNYFDFILESSSKIKVPFQLHIDFLLLLYSIKSPISSSLIELVVNHSLSDISLISAGEEVDTASYTTALKLSQHFGTTNDADLARYVRPLNYDCGIYYQNRTTIKIGRLIRKLFANKFNDSEIESFVNQYKSIMESKSTRFEIWEGQKILEGYISKNYNYEGPSSNALMNSCMNDEVDLIDFYLQVPVKLLVLLDTSNHIVGRSLIWKTNLGDFMDRTYTIHDKDYYKFINYAHDNKIIYKSINRSGAHVDYIKHGKEFWENMFVSLNFDINTYNLSTDIKGVPYMDTFIYGQDKILSNTEPKDGKFFIFQETDGTAQYITILYDIYGQRIPDIDRYNWSETQQGWIYNADSIWIKTENDWFSRDYLDNPKNGFTKVISGTRNSYVRK